MKKGKIDKWNKDVNAGTFMDTFDKLIEKYPTDIDLMIHIFKETILKHLNKKDGNNIQESQS